MKFPFQNITSGPLKHCQITGHENMIEVVDLGDQPLSDTLLSEKDLSTKEKFYPLKVFRSPKSNSS